MELLDRIEEHLQRSYGYNYFFEFDESEEEECNSVADLLNRDYGFVDIVLNRDSFKEMLDGYTEDNPYGKYAYFQDSFRSVILKKMGIEFDIDLLTEFSFERKMIDALNVKNKYYIRLHVFSDYISDEKLQMVINDYITMNCFTIFLYKSKELKTYYNGGAMPILHMHDYYSEASKKFERKRNLRIERFEEDYD